MVNEAEAAATWQFLADEMAASEPDVVPGKMMSAPALTCGGKVFAFYSTKGGGTGLGVRLGRDFDIEGLGLTDWQHLAPFRTKPPMKDWIICGLGDQARWPELMRLGLMRMRG